MVGGPEVGHRLAPQRLFRIGPEDAAGAGEIVLLHAAIVAELQVRRRIVRMADRVHETGFVGEDALDARAEVAPQPRGIAVVGQRAEPLHGGGIKQVHPRGTGADLPDQLAVAPMGLDAEGGQLGVPVEHLAAAAAAGPVVLVVEPDRHVVQFGCLADLLAKVEPGLAHVGDFATAAGVDQELVDPHLVVLAEPPLDKGPVGLAGHGGHGNEG